MNVLMIGGDKNALVKGAATYERVQLQKSAVDRLEVVYWGRGSLWPAIPTGPFDVVTVQDPFVRGLFAWFMARRIGTKLNAQLHADLEAQSWWRQIIARFVLRRADSVRVVSQKTKAQVERLGAKRISVLPVYVDISRFKTVMRRPHEGKNMLWVGRFEGEKNPLQAIEVLREVCKEEPAARLTMLGEGTLTQALSQAAKELPVDLPGWQDPISYLETADVVLSTSPAESFGVSIIEALAAGVPVVCLDVGVAKEAGASVASSYEELSKKVVEVLRKGEPAELKINLLTKDEWLAEWRKSL